MSKERALLLAAKTFLTRLPLTGIKAVYCRALSDFIQNLLERPSPSASLMEMQQVFLLLRAVCAIERPLFFFSEAKVFGVALPSDWNQFKAWVFRSDPGFADFDAPTSSFNLLKLRPWYCAFMKFLQVELIEKPLLMRQGVQRALNSQLIKFIKCGSAFTSLDVIQKEKIPALFLRELPAGVCYGYSCVYGLMNCLGHPEYWDVFLNAIASWDGTAAALEKSISWPKMFVAINTLSDVFKSFLYLSFYFQGLMVGVPQYDVLSPVGFSRIASVFGKGFDFTVKDRKEIVGDFDLHALKLILTFEFLYGRICVISYNHLKHAAGFGFYSDGRAFYYDSGGEGLTVFDKGDVAADRHLSLVLKYAHTGRASTVIEIASSDELILNPAQRASLLEGKYTIIPEIVLPEARSAVVFATEMSAAGGAGVAATSPEH